MSKNESIDLITTHNYILTAVESLAQGETHDMHHRIASTELEPTADIPAVHTIETSLTVPVTVHAESETLRPNGEQTLTTSIWLAAEEQQVEPGAGQGVRYLDDGRIQYQLASTYTWFNTRRTLESLVYLTADGERLGLREADIPDLLTHFWARKTGSRMRRVQTIAEDIKALSLEHNGSRELVTGSISFDELSADMETASGLARPESLTPPNLPHVNIKETLSHHSDIDHPRVKTMEVVIDEYIQKARTRLLTTYLLTQYEGFTPLFNEDNDHFAFHGTETPTGQPAEISFGIDVWRQEITPNDGGITVASTETEARAMMSGFIRATTNLRRYNTRALHRIEASA